MLTSATDKRMRSSMKSGQSRLQVTHLERLAYTEPVQSQTNVLFCKKED